MEYTLVKDGFTLVRQVLCENERTELLATLAAPERAGRRGLLAIPRIRGLAESEKLLNLVRPHLLAEPIAVRAIYFDKSSEANWLVPWHQDLTIAVALQAECSGFGPWSVKDGIPHVQPPVECLENMLAVRLHFDECDENNGALKVLSGTHRYGKLTTDQIANLREQGQEIICRAAAEGAVLMRPLSTHASSRSTSKRHRRVLHIEYAGFALPTGLCWSKAA